MAHASPTTRRRRVSAGSPNVQVSLPIVISSPGSKPQQPPTPQMIAMPPVSSPVSALGRASPAASPQQINNNAKYIPGLAKDVSEMSGPLSTNVKTEYGAAEDTTPLPSRSPSPHIVSSPSSGVDERPHDFQEKEGESQKQRSKSPTKNHDPETRASSPTPSLPELRELLASTQTGRKARPSVAPSQEVAESRPAPPRSRKRRHSSGQEGSPPKRHESARRRHRDFWELDGSVVLQFENIMFRLHRSDLVRRSKYFADLFASPRAHENTVDGCPVYRIPGKAKDFERLWRAIDDAISYVHTPPSFDVFASILRAATDLEFPSFRAWAVKTFEAMWPTDLASLTDEHKPHAAESIILARSFDVPNVLRHAFYELSRHANFGLTVDSDDEGDIEAESGGEGEDLAKLSRNDITRLIQLRSRLQTDWLSVLQMAPGSCGEENSCRISDAWASDIVKRDVFEDGFLDPLRCLGKLDVGGLCKMCRQKAKNGWEKRKEKIWKSNLDLWLGLG